MGHTIFMNRLNKWMITAFFLGQILIEAKAHSMENHLESPRLVLLEAFPDEDLPMKDNIEKTDRIANLDDYRLAPFKDKKAALNQALAQNNVVELACLYLWSKRLQEEELSGAIGFGLVAAGTIAAAPFTLGISSIGTCVAGPICIGNSIWSHKLRKLKCKAKDRLLQMILITAFKELKKLPCHNKDKNIRYQIENILNSEAN